jgi:hypothetical protein
MSQSTTTAESSHRTRFRAAIHSARMNSSEPIMSTNVVRIGWPNRKPLATAATIKPATDSPRAIHWSEESVSRLIFVGQGTRFYHR